MKRGITKRVFLLVIAVLSILLAPVVALAEGQENVRDDAVFEEAYYLGGYEDIVNTGLDTGYAEDNALEENDPHFGWQLGRFSIKGHTRIARDDSSDLVVLKSADGSLALRFECLQDDIDQLNGNSELSVAVDSNGFDQRLGVERTNFGRGTMILKHTDFQNSSASPVVCSDYLSASANEAVTIDEEGDYDVVFDYELLDHSKLLFDTVSNPFAPAYTNYRMSFHFKVRNDDCMVYPFDLETGEELINGSYSAAGFRIDTARSPYLDINIEHDVLHGASGDLVSDPRSNAAASDGASYTDEGVYTITGKNLNTGLEISKTIYVGDNALLKSYAATGLSLDALKEKVADGAIIADDGMVFDKGEGNWLNQDFLDYLGGQVYDDVVDAVDKSVFIENVQVGYLSKEYLSTLAGNSKENVYFGLTLDEIDDALEEDRYVFSPDESGSISVRSFKPYDDSCERIAKNVAIGGGVILVCVVATTVTGGTAAPTVASVVACSAADGAASFSLMSGAIGGVSAGIIKGYETGDMNEALKAAALQGSEDFKLGAISGALLAGGGSAVGMASKGVALKGANLATGFSVKEAAVVQQAARLKGLNWTKNTVKEFSSVEEANIYLEADLKELTINGKRALISKKINWKHKDSNGMTNVERLNSQKPPVDENNVSFQVHHIGQKNDSLLAVLSKEEHVGAGNSAILHPKATSDVEHGAEFFKEKRELFGGIAEAHSKGKI